MTKGADFVATAQSVLPPELDDLLGKPTIEQKVGGPVRVALFGGRAQQPSRQQPDVEALDVVPQVLGSETRDILRGDEDERLDVTIGGAPAPHHALLQLVARVLVETALMHVDQVIDA